MSGQAPGAWTEGCSDMTDDIGPTIGQALARLRGSRMTQNALAAAAGVSVDLVRKLEQGRRHTVSIASLHRLARALDVDAGELLGRPSALPDPGPYSGAVAIRRALTAVDDLIGDDEGVEPLTIDEARRIAGYAWAGYWAGHYDALGRLLPSAIGQVRATTRAVASTERAEAHDLSAQVHQVAACTLVHLGYGDIAHLALREALTLARQGPDPLRPSALLGSVAWVLLTQGRYAESQRLASAAADSVSPAGDDDMPALTLHGALLLNAATAAGRGGDRGEAGALLDEAREVADRTGYRTDYETAFGPDQVRMQTVDVDVVTENYGEALTEAAQMPPNPSLPLAARCRHLSDVALSHARLGGDRAALDTLLTVERAAPTWMSFQSQPRQIVRELRERATNPPRLAPLAERMGLARA